MRMKPKYICKKCWEEVDYVIGEERFCIKCYLNPGEQNE
jgi:hypothetical protein